MDVEAWLLQLGLGQHLQAFRDAAIDGEVLRELSDGHPRELGLPLGHRLKLLKAIAELGSVSSPSGSVARPNAAGDVADSSPPSHAERRQLTVMFVDLVGSTALSVRLDPEDMQAILRAYQNAVAAEIRRLGGHVARYMGDGVLVYFGWPKAYEDAAERAVQAGLAVVAAIGSVLTNHGERLTARVGIATGLVVVGDMAGEDSAREDVVGETPNLAARLQTIAEPGTVVIAAETRTLLGQTFDLEDLGQQALRGVPGPVRAYRVLREGRIGDHFEARHSLAPFPLVGRHQELALLQERWRQASAGEGQMVLLSGEAGIGKSRIAQALLEVVAAEPHTRLRLQCSPYHTDSALHPAIQQLELAAGFTLNDRTEARLDKLERMVSETLVDSEPAMPLVAALLGLDGAGRYRTLDLSPQQQRNRTLQALVSLLLGLANKQPVLFVVEDAHWIDPTALELLDLCLDQIVTARVLVLITARPTFAHGFGGHPIVTRLALNRLGREETAAIVDRLTDGKALPGVILDEIAAKTDGVPLFVEELTKTVLESGLLRATDDTFVLERPFSRLAIPTTLHDSLMARLDRLHPVKETAQTAACIGRQFTYGLLAAISPMPEAELQDALEQLTAAELVFRRGVPPDASYTFKHALVRDAAYESLLKARRHQIHARLLQVLGLPSAETKPEILAHHATEAGLSEKAID
jgi:class 3 adenylate cyclase